MRHTTWLVRLPCLFLAASLAACGGSSGGGDAPVTFRAVAEADLQNRSFGFGPGFFDADTARLPQGSTLTVGRFLAGAAPISLVSDDGSIAGGTLTLGSCDVTLSFLALAGAEPVFFDAADPDASSVFDPCEIGSNGALRLTDPGLEVFVSAPGAAAVVLEQLTVPLSPAFEVEPSAPLDGRPESGTATLRFLTGNLLEYTVSVSNLSEGDALTNSHIHTGGVAVNGPVFVTLVGAPGQPPRPVVPAFAGNTSVTAATVLTPEESAALGQGDDFYVNVHSQQVPAGLVRGQLRQSIAAALNIPLSAAAEVPVNADHAAQLVGRTETGFATLRILDDDTLAYTLRVTGLTAGDSLTNAHVHSGASDVTGPVVLTLVGAPDDGRTTNTSFAGGTAVTAEFLLTPEEVVELTTSSTPYYVNVHSVQVPGGLVRGQLRDAVRFASQIQPIFTASCAVPACHVTGGGAPMSLEAGVARGNIVGQPAVSGGTRVVPGDAAASVLFQRLVTSNPLSRMPLGSSPLPASQQGLIQAWIDQGAADN